MRLRLIFVMLPGVPALRRLRPQVLSGLVLVLTGLVLDGCGISRPLAGPGQLVAVGAESQYADVIAQVGGPYVKVAAILSNPNSDPHSFEASPSVAATLAEAKLIVENGLGYDSFMPRIEAATPAAGRQIIDVQHLLGFPNATGNPHLWYAPATMPRVAIAVAAALGRLEPAHIARFRAGAARFIASLAPWHAALRRLRHARPGVPVATSEPVGDDLLAAAGAHNLTPWHLQADIMNGTDPAPQDVTAQDALFTQHRVEAFVYNEQVTDTITQSFLRLAAENHIPVVGIDETMPPHEHYGGWMLAETDALTAAILDGISTPRLG